MLDEEKINNTFSESIQNEETPIETPPIETSPIETPPIETPPIEIPPQTEVTAGYEPVEMKSEKKGNGKKILIGVVIAVAVIALIIAVFKVLNQKDPKTVVTDAFKSIYAAETNPNPVDEIFGFKDLYNSMYSIPIENKVSLTLDKFNNKDMEEYVVPYLGSGFSMNGLYDMSNTKYRYDFNVMYAGNNLTSANFYMDDKDMILALPDFTENAFKLTYGEKLKEQIEASPYLGKYIEESGINIDAINDYMAYVKKMSDPKTRGFNLSALWERYKNGSEALDSFKEAMQVEKADKAVYTVNDKEQKCQGYKVTFTKDATIKFIRTSSKFFMEDETLKKDLFEYMQQVLTLSQGAVMLHGNSESTEDVVNELLDNADKDINEFVKVLEKYMNDVTMTVYVTKDGKMAYIEGNTTVDYDKEVYDISFDMTLKGGYFLTQNFDANFIVSGPSDYNITITNEGTYDKKVLTADVNCEITADNDTASSDWSSTYNVDSGDFNLEFSSMADDTDMFTVNVKGIVDNLERGKSIEFLLDSMDIDIPTANTSFTFSGAYSVNPYTGSIEAPDGDTIDILAATEDDINSIGLEMYSKLYSLMSQLQ